MIEILQDVWITFKEPSTSNHVKENLKGSILRFPIGVRKREIGIWSEATEAKILDSGIKVLLKRDELTRIWSNLPAM